MTQQTIGVGAFPNDTTGDPLLTAFQKVNANFTELYTPVARTAAEIAAGVPPTNFGYAPGDIRRYGGSGDGVTNNFTAFQQAVAVCKANGSALLIPAGNFVINTASGTLSLSYVTFLGTGVTDGSATPAAAGSVISIIGTANSPFTCGPGVTFDGIAFFYPVQVDSATPIVFPPTIITSVAIAGAINFVYIQNCTVFNAYRFFVDTDTSGALGHVFFINNTIYGILTCFEIAHNAEIVTFIGNEFTFGHYLAATEGGLRGYTRANGSVGIINRTDGITFQGNVAFGYLNGLNFATSATLCQLTSILGNYWDNVRFPILATGTGNLSTFVISDNVSTAFNNINTALVGNHIKITTSGALALESISITGNVFGTCTGDAVLISGVPSRSINCVSNQFTGVGGFQTVGSYGCFNVSGASSSYLFSGNYCTNQAGTPAVANGILGSASTAVVTGNTFGGYNAAINAAFTTIATSGNLSYGTITATSDVISATNIYSVNNLWDKASGSTTRPQLRISKNASQTFAIGATGVPVTFPFTAYDKAGNWTSGTSTWTAKQAGRYRFSWMLFHDNSATAGERWTFTLTPSSGQASTFSYVTIANFNSFLAMAEFDLPNGATVQLLASQQSGTHNLVTFNDGNSNYMTASLIE